MKKTRSFRSQAYKIAAIFGVVAALICFIVVAVGGAFPTSKRGTSIVVPHAGETWQVGELHTVQWTLSGMKTVNDKGENITARLILSYGGGANSHIPLGELTDWFNIADTLANIMVPSVPTRDDYALYMFSRDEPDISSWSGSVTIFNPNDVDGQDEPPSSIVVTTAPPVSVTKSLASTFSESPSTTHSALLSLPSVSLTLGLSLSLPLLSATSTASPSAITAVSPASATVSASESTSSSAAPLSPTNAATPSSVAVEPTTAPSATQMATAQGVQTASTAPNRMKRAGNCLRHDQRQVH